MLLSHLNEWAPFRLDALGIVTILGADQMDLTIGRLAQTGVAGLLPVLGAYKVADNSIIRPIPGFHLYNVSDGILATDLTGWFARWLLAQEVTFTSTTIKISAEKRSFPELWLRYFQQYVVAFVIFGSLCVLVVLTGDWWGFANLVAMLASVVVRCIIIQQNCAALDSAVSKGLSVSNETVKTLLTLPTGDAVTIYVPRGILLQCLLTTPRPAHPSLYGFIRGLGWLSFGIHVISLGMAKLLNQLLAVAVLLISTILVAWKIGDNDSWVGSRLLFERYDFDGPDFRAAAMARLELSPTEEDTMLAWNLFPQKTNQAWWQKYRISQAAPKGKGFRNWDSVLATPFTTIAPVSGAAP